MIKIEVGPEVEERLIDRIDMEVLLGHEIEENRNHLGRHLKVVGHPWDGIDHAFDFGKITSPADVGDSVFLLKIRRGGHHDA
jgi:hypothetical protein